MSAGWVPVVDISYAQGECNFAVMKAAGIPGVIIRACNAMRRDIRFDRNWRTARDAGLDVAVYGFSNPKAVAGPEDQGAFLAGLAYEANAAWIMHDEEGYDREAGPNPVLKGAPAAAWTAAKVRLAARNSGMRQVLYSGQSYWNSTFTPGALDKLFGRFTPEWRADLEYLATFPIIIARYIAQRQGPPVFDPLPRGVTPDHWADVVLATGKAPGIPKGFTAESIIAHQFSAGGNGQGAVYGCGSTDLDLNIFRKVAYDDLFAISNPEPLPEDEMAYIVCNSEAQLGNEGPGVGPGPPLANKFRVREEGDLVPLSGTDLKAMGIANSPGLGIPLTNAELAEMGYYDPASPIDFKLPVTMSLSLSGGASGTVG